MFGQQDPRKSDCESIRESIREILCLQEIEMPERYAIRTTIQKTKMKLKSFHNKKTRSIISSTSEEESEDNISLSPPPLSRVKWNHTPPPLPQSQS
mmetsp:Transcript_34382/g.45534  ORF Transcript_34382/g.45534 Transcript_34382/m.45534 type:complete len:96 (-) Transcript_34382:1110-1397(-)